MYIFKDDKYSRIDGVLFEIFCSVYKMCCKIDVNILVKFIDYFVILLKVMIDDYLNEVIILVGWRVGCEKLIFFCFFFGLVDLLGIVVVILKSILGEELMVVILDFWFILIFIGMLLLFSGIVMWVLVRSFIDLVWKWIMR